VEPGVNRGAAAGQWNSVDAPVWACVDSFASGWMRIRGARRRRSLDRGFVLSDHADWPALLSAIDATGAASVWVTHGYRLPLVRWLRDRGRDARVVETRFEGEQDEIEEAE